MICTIQTSTFGHYGGIPTYNRIVSRALNELVPGGDPRILISMDQHEDVSAQTPLHPNLRMEAFAANRRRMVSRLLNIGIRERIDLALVGHVNYAPLARFLKLIQPDMRYGVFIYGTEVWDELPRLRRRALCEADFVISISEYTKQRAVQANNVKPERVHLLPNALEHAATLEQPCHRSISADELTLLSVCRLDAAEQQKGVDTVIQALPAVLSRVPNVRYLVVGSGTDLERHKALTSSLGVSSHVTFLGFVDDEKLLAYYRQCDLFVLPSAQEGFGFVFLEAMYHSKPIVAASNGGVPEVVQDGVSGLLVPYGDIGALSEALVRLCLDQDERVKMGGAGYERVQKYYTYHEFRKTLADILLRELPREAAYRARRGAISKHVEIG